MERLTKRATDSFAIKRNVLKTPTKSSTCTDCKKGCEDCSLQIAVARLAAYEDTGLEPDMCAEYKKFEDELIASGKTFQHILDLLAAEKDGRLVVLPYGKVGDFVEWNNGVSFRLYEIKYMIICRDGIRYDLGEFQPFINHKQISRILSREEAEEALRKENTDDN